MITFLLVLPALLICTMMTVVDLSDLSWPWWLVGAVVWLYSWGMAWLVWLVRNAPLDPYDTVSGEPDGIPSTDSAVHSSGHSSVGSAASRGCQTGSAGGTATPRTPPSSNGGNNVFFIARIWDAQGNTTYDAWPRQR